MCNFLNKKKGSMVFYLLSFLTLERIFSFFPLFLLSPFFLFYNFPRNSRMMLVLGMSLSLMGRK